MGFSEEEAISALEYMKQLKITAELDPADRKTLRFNRTPALPDTISEDVRAILEICIEYHQRSVFTGEHLGLDTKPPIYRSSGDPLDEINFFLEYYKHLLIKEVEKGLDLTLPAEKDLRPERKSTPFVKAMLKHRAKQRKNK
ncbi:MAG: hypothetical protein HOC09_12930 [Deltaproteobacteria bacterium]|jgi:hypothetical protein|nr:hypothetical protein [Deltaproteobacteria bacterium]MBT4639721.1 hypothetical protein [Deltaproteobacteria bacterium]